MHQKLKFDNVFRLKFTIQEMTFRLCTKQSTVAVFQLVLCGKTLGRQVPVFLSSNYDDSFGIRQSVRDFCHKSDTYKI